ncbi:hypothetical protein V5N11_021626 [Cardamine amara subsp. amara]|uniref:DUF4283 domain-containing protein n=1 Tax=Cardamine amara subsp. amara TaxID=228776 RepID=A0ABD0ZVU8_CARAN
MSDNTRKRMQDIMLRANDAPIVLPNPVCVQAARSNWFFIVGTLENPRKHNLRAIIGNLPRAWGMEDTVVGRMLHARKFQFVFQTEEALNLVLK